MKWVRERGTLQPLSQGSDPGPHEDMMRVTSFYWRGEVAASSVNPQAKHGADAGMDNHGGQELHGSAGVISSTLGIMHNSRAGGRMRAALETKEHDPPRPRLLKRA